VVSGVVAAANRQESAAITEGLIVGPSRWPIHSEREDRSRRRPRNQGVTQGTWVLAVLVQSQAAATAKKGYCSSQQPWRSNSRSPHPLQLHLSPGRKDCERRVRVQ
jgi:hypothetical protein